jgi:Domain of unknown function (DUF4157)
MNEMETMNKQYQPTAEPAQAGRKVQPFFQAKLSINQPNDAYEVEADAMADKVMRMEMPSNGLQLKPLPISSVQRKCAHCEKEKKMQRKEMNGSETTADVGLESYVGGLHSGGQALSAEARNFYEPRFGYDFSNVKLHTDSVAAKSAQSINALAYTSGNNIVFNNGQFSPNTDSGKRLLGHELTHVVQQGGGQNVVSRFIQRTNCEGRGWPDGCVAPGGCDPGMQCVASADWPVCSCWNTSVAEQRMRQIVPSWIVALLGALALLALIACFATGVCEIAIIIGGLSTGAAAVLLAIINGLGLEDKKSNPKTASNENRNNESEQIQDTV